MPLNPGNSGEAGPSVNHAALAESDFAKPEIRSFTLFFAYFTFVVGLFLLVYPWMDLWALNHLPEQFQMFSSNPMFRDLQDFWDDPYFRGAISGLGLWNVSIALRTLIRLARTK